MPRKGPRSRTLTICLAKKAVHKPERLLQNREQLQRYTVQIGNNKRGSLYVASQQRKPPSWVSLFQGRTRPDLPQLHNASTSAVLLVRGKHRTFAVTFGYGRHFLNPGAYEENFGLRVALNAVRETGIRSVDRRTFEGLSRQIRTQATHETTFAEIGIDVEQEVLRQVTGHPTNADLGTRLVGMESLTVTSRTDLRNLMAKLEEYYRLFTSKDYKKRFPWADQFQEVRDPEVVERLNDNLSDRLRKGALERLWLAVPEIIDWRDVAGFRYTGSKKETPVDDLHLARWLETVDVDQLGVENLKRKHVSCVGTTGDAVLHCWTVLRCLYAETERDGDTFILTDGKWYRIEQGVVRSVNRSIRQIPDGPTLPAYEDASEHAYCKRVAAARSLVLMDRKNIPYGGGHSSVEFCDLLGNRKQFIHIKRYAGSSVLSHLFSQGVVSASLFLGEAEFRREVNKRLPAGQKFRTPAKRPEPSKFEVVFAIVSHSDKPLSASLPFFSRLTLRNAIRSLKTAGYRVSLTKIPVR